MRSFIPIFVLAASIAGCATPASDSASESHGELTSSAPEVICAKPTASDDDAYLIYGSCARPGVKAAIQLRAVDAPAPRQLAELEPTDRVRVLRVTRGFAWWLLRHGDGTEQLYFQAVDAPLGAAPFAIALGAAGRDLDGVALSDQGVAVVGLNDARGERFLVVGGPGGVLTTTIDLGRATGMQLVSANEGRDIALILHGGASAHGYIAGTRQVHITGSSVTVGPLVRPDGHHLWNFEPGSYDGDSFLAYAGTPSGGSYIRVDAETGTSLTLAGGFDYMGETLGVTNDEAWFTARRRDNGTWVLYRVRRDGSSSTLLATEREGLRARMTHDRSRIVLSTGVEGRVNALRWVPSDGSSTATTILDEGAGQLIRLDRDAPSLPAGRFLVHLTEPTTNIKRTLLVDDRTGWTVAHWREGSDYRGDLTVAGNGGAVFAFEPCNPTAGGQTLVQLWPSRVDVTGCGVDPMSVLTIPKTNALAVTNGNYPPTLRILKP